MRVTDPQAIKAPATMIVGHDATSRSEPPTNPVTPQLTVEQLIRVRDAAHAVAAHRGVHRFDDFLSYKEPRRRDMLGLLARGMAHKAFRR